MTLYCESETVQNGTGEKKMIRNYAADDYEAVVSIATRAWAQIFEGLKKQMGDEVFKLVYQDPVRTKALQIQRHVDAHPDWCYVAERNGKIVGFITFALIPETGMAVISNNASDPDSGEKGVGQEMYAAVLDRFRSEGMRLAQVTTGLDEAHAPARRAYERAGFQKHTESVTYYMTL